MAHIAFYRAWRPQRFQDVVGQKHIIQTLQNSLKDGRITHAYLFSGPRGTGKTSAAKILAKAVNCERGPAAEPCNECASCLRITSGSLMDVVELDAASNRGVEDIRDIRDKVKYAPTEVRLKVYIIDEVHMLTTEAFNGLLKTLEEPPAHVMFILATTEPHKLPATVVSRCQRFDFRRVSLEEQVERLQYVCGQESIAMTAEAAQYIARLSEGSMRDAMSLLDQVVSYSGRRIEYADVVAMTGDVAADQFRQLAEAMKAKDVGLALDLIGRFMQEGKSADKCMESLIHYFRDILLLKMLPGSRAVTDRILDAGAFGDIISAFDREEIFAIIGVLNHYQTEMKYSAQPQTLFEVAVMKICTAANDSPQEAAARKTADSAGGPPAHELALIRQQLDKLERQVQQVLQAGGAAQAAGESGAGSASPQRKESGRQTAAPQAAAAAGGTARTAPTAAQPRPSAVPLSHFLRGGDSADFKQVRAKWSVVLSQVKDRKITVHAWLVNGEPVSFADNTVLLAFHSAMHRDTTEKPANKQIVEQAMSEVLGHAVRFVSVMHKDWEEAARADSAAPSAEAEEMQLVPERPGEHKEEWINQAIELFGEDLVEIKEN